MPIGVRSGTSLIVVDARFGVAADGATDDTVGLQDALDAVDAANGITDVFVPGGTYMVRGVNSGSTLPWGQSGSSTRNRWIGGGLLPKSGTRLHLAPDAILKVIPNGTPAYSCIFLGRGQDDVTISGGQILGDRATHDYASEPTYTTHEYGYGIALRGATGVTIEGVSISGCTGDGIYVGAQGLKNDGDDTDYYPSERVRVRDCTIDGSRRNNISVTGCSDVAIEGNTLTRAGYNDGVHDGTAPRLGIDIENYGEGSTDYQTALNVSVRGNVCSANVGGAIENFNGYGVEIENNFTDGLITFGFGTETIIRGNVVMNLADTTGDGIGSNDFTTGEYDAQSVVANNIVIGFGTGIKVQRADVLVTGNFVSKFQTTGISVFGCDGVTVQGNRVSDGQGATANAYAVGSSTKVTFSANTSRNTYRAFNIITNSTQVVIEGNTVTQGYQGINVAASCQAVIKGNLFDLAGHTAGESYGCTWTGSSIVLCDGNVFRSPSTYAVSATNTAASGKSRIVGNRVIDGTATSSFSLTGGKHEVVDNTFIINRSSGTIAPILLAGTMDKTLILGNKAWASGAGALTYLATCTGGAVTNTRVVGNTVVGPASVINGDAGTPVDAGNNLVAT